MPEPVTALQLGGVVYVPLSDREATTELAVAHLADRTEPHLERAVAAVTVARHRVRRARQAGGASCHSTTSSSLRPKRTRWSATTRANLSASTPSGTSTSMASAELLRAS